MELCISSLPGCSGGGGGVTRAETGSYRTVALQLPFPECRFHQGSGNMLDSDDSFSSIDNALVPWQDAYPNFARTTSNHAVNAVAAVHLVQEFGWQKVRPGGFGQTEHPRLPWHAAASTMLLLQPAARLPRQLPNCYARSTVAVGARGRPGRLRLTTRGEP